jgi:hypothetical protein
VRVNVSVLIDANRKRKVAASLSQPMAKIANFALAVRQFGIQLLP